MVLHFLIMVLHIPIIVQHILLLLIHRPYMRNMLYGRFELIILVVEGWKIVGYYCSSLNNAGMTITHISESDRSMQRICYSSVVWHIATYRNVLYDA